MAVGKEYGVVAEAFATPGRPHQRAVDAALEGLAVTVGPGEREGADEMGAAVRLVLEGPFHPRHRPGEVPLRPGPACRMDARRAPERRHHQARVVGERRQAGGPGRGARLVLGIGPEAFTGFLRLGQAQLGRRGHMVDQRPQQVADLLYLAGVVAGDHQGGAFEAPRRGPPLSRPGSLRGHGAAPSSERGRGVAAR